MEVFTMARKVNQANANKVLRCILANSGNVRANDIARQTGMHPQSVSRLLSTMDETTGVLLQEDDHGFLGIFGRRKK